VTTGAAEPARDDGSMARYRGTRARYRLERQILPWFAFGQRSEPKRHSRFLLYFQQIRARPQAKEIRRLSETLPKKSRGYAFLAARTSGR
jgi:hypothetical protein